VLLPFWTRPNKFPVRSKGKRLCPSRTQPLPFVGTASGSKFSTENKLVPKPAMVVWFLFASEPH
jgi:hypothetical protein